METNQHFIERKEKEFSDKKNEYDKRIKNGKKIAKRLLIDMKDIGRQTRMFFVREAWTFEPQSNLAQKVFIIERLKKYICDKSKMAYPNSWQEGDIEYRIGYYIVGKIGGAEDKWIWGQYCPIIPGHDLKKLLSNASEKGTLSD